MRLGGLAEARLAGDDVVRLILDGTVVRVRLDRKATSLSVLVALGVRRDGQKVLLALRNMGGESKAAWRVLLDDLVARGLAVLELVIVDGASGLEKAIAALWNDVPLQRCTVHKHRNLLAHAPKTLYDEISADYADMTMQESPRWMPSAGRSCANGGGAAARSPPAWKSGRPTLHLPRFPSDQWKSIRTTNAIERLHKEFKRRIKTQCMLPCADTACMLFGHLGQRADHPTQS